MFHVQIVQKVRTRIIKIQQENNNLNKTSPFSYKRKSNSNKRKSKRKANSYKFQQAHNYPSFPWFFRPKAIFSRELTKV